MFLLALVAVMSIGAANAQDKGGNQPRTDGPVINFAKLTHNYDTIARNSAGTCSFKFTNDGNEPIILSNVRASCGCTVPTWPKEPIMPGQTGVIDVKYNTSNPGRIDKYITVTSNAVNNNQIRLRIIGFVADK